MKKITYIILLFLTFNFGYGQIITFDFNGATGSPVSYNSNFNDPGLSTSTITRGSGLTNVNNNDRFNAQNWALTSIANAVSGNDYMEFTITPNASYQFDVTSIDINFQRSSTGVRGLALRSSIDSYATDIDAEKVVIDNTNIQTFSFNVSQTNNSTAVTYRFYGWAESTGGSGGFEGGGSDIVVNGSVTVVPPCSGGTVTWTSGAWDNAGVGPDSTTPVIIDANYNTATDGGSFSACTLTVNSGFRLTVGNGDYVEVENDVTVDGQLFLETQGNFVQNSDAATFTDNSITPNGVLMNKTKTVANKFVYTFWSSPVVNETIENVFSTVPADKRFEFIAVNFVDLLQEIGNSNPPVFVNNPGVDDIDDNGDDWNYASGVLTPGVGYAMRTNLIGPAFPRPETFVFRGAFNNGIITIPLVNNSGGQYNDWNLIGNPYPSAINVSQFFTVNAGIVDVVYLWDQATPIDSNASGNQQYNYSVSDYAMINSSGAISGARSNSGTPPNGSIASGQGFFVEALAASNVTFNNSMRAIGTTDNSQFFKNTKTKEKSNSMLTNKLWVDLSTDNGVYNQILVSYIDHATNGNDGSGYDAKRIVSSGNAAFLYSAIENDNGKFAIQGKAPSDLNENEIINLGFKTSINVATLYTLSIAQLQGDFLSSNTVYLKDNVLNKIHDLSNSDYTFTSEIGEFNNRFQIAFSNKALSTDNISLNDNHLKIVELNNNRVNFKTSENLNIKAVKIYDLLGRELYNLKGNNSSETYELSNLKSNIYIAKVELSNGVTITKKAIKK